MKRRTKVLVIIGSSLLALIIIALLVGAILLFNIALSPTFFDEIAPQDIEPMGQSKFVTKEQRTWLSDTSDEVWITSNDKLNLHGYLGLQTAPSDIYVLILHGYKSNGLDMAAFAQHYYDMGWNYLAVDHRAHGQSEGKYIGMGWLEKDDTLLWIDYILSIDPQAKIVLHGVSMGAATTLMTTGMDLPQNVKAAVSDCAYTNVADIFTYQLKQAFNLPAFPLLPLASMVSQFAAGYNFYEASSLKQVAKSSIPTLFIHGSDDTFVEFSMLQEIYDAAACEKEMLVVQGAPHAFSNATNPQLYWQTVDTFLEQFV